ncbi:MAG: hypothetical protein J6U12_05155 [Candidatus Methanomethylophilaceae archaeon]|nr:hypothetical protein [Candidatus Methanomethylophilaceae archaeon]
MAIFSAKNAGLAFMIVAVLNVIAAILMIVLKVVNEDDYANGLVYFIILAVGTLICACLYFTYGQKVRSGAIDRKIDILATYVKIVGIATIIDGLFTAVALIVDGADIGAALVGAVVAIIIGLIILFIASKINDGKQTIGDKLIWIILLIVFVIMILVSVAEAVLGAITIIGLIDGICGIIIYSFMVLLLIDEEVKSEMGI